VFLCPTNIHTHIVGIDCHKNITIAEKTAENVVMNLMYRKLKFSTHHKWITFTTVLIWNYK
jgi:hypothetical protein